MARSRAKARLNFSAQGQVGQQAGHGSVNRCVGLAQDACQLHRIDKRHPAEEVEQLSV